jgi:hypothetical protein
MPVTDYWCKVDLRFPKDDKTEAIGEKFGPAGPLAMLVLLLNAKSQNRGGKVEGTYRDLAHDVHIDRDEAAKVLEGLVQVGYAEGELNGRNFKLFLPAYKRWNDRQRKQEQREREREQAECHNDVTTCHDLSQDVTKNRLDKTRETPKRLEIEAVFNAWVSATGRNLSRVNLTKARADLIARRLKEYPVEDLIDACHGLGASAFHRGDNDRGKRYDTLELCLRDASKIEGFRDEHRGDAAPPTTVNKFLED